MKIYIPSKSVENDSNIKHEQVNSKDKENIKINLNLANKNELMQLPGIGDKKADLIIEYRLEKSFTKIEDLMNISGIGNKIFEKLKDYITI